jgi:hypothetical protein
MRLHASAILVWTTSGVDEADWTVDMKKPEQVLQLTLKWKFYAKRCDLL